MLLPLTRCKCIASLALVIASLISSFKISNQFSGGNDHSRLELAKFLYDEALKIGEEDQHRINASQTTERSEAAAARNFFNDHDGDEQFRERQRWRRRRRAASSELLTHGGMKMEEDAPSKLAAVYTIHVAAIHIERSEFPLSKRLFRLTLQLALDSVNKNLESKRVQLSLSVRSANTCSRQFAGAIAAEEYYLERARLFVVSGCDAAIRSVSRLASNWRIPTLTAAGFGADLNDKSIHRTLIRVAFSLQSAVEFLVKILKSFQWRRVNLIVDESDPNSLALRHSIERHLDAAAAAAGTPSSGGGGGGEPAEAAETNSSSSSGGSAAATMAAAAAAAAAAAHTGGATAGGRKAADDSSVHLNTISIDFQSLTSLVSKTSNLSSSSSSSTTSESPPHNRSNWPASNQQSTKQRRPESVADGSPGGPSAGEELDSDPDRWPNSATESAVRDALRQSSLFSRVNVLLIPQIYLRKFMLTVYDQGMANGLYTFINMPLLLLSNSGVLEDQPAPPADGGSNSSSGARPAAAASYVPTTAASMAAAARNVFIWRLRSSARNSQARQAFESLMSIYLRTPTSKAYVYFTSKLSNFASEQSMAAAAAAVAADQHRVAHHRQQQQPPAAPHQLDIHPYSASFYDCLQVYALALQESLLAIERQQQQQRPTATAAASKQQLAADFHGQISDRLRNRRFENMVTGTIFINQNGDRDTEYTLDDLNQMTGKYSPVILYRSESKQIERLARIQWSSDEAVGPTVDSADCNLTGSCQGRPIPRFLVTLVLLATPMGAIMGALLFFIYKHLSLESQLVDYWWRINFADIELLEARRKTAGCASSASSVILAGGGGAGGSHVSSGARRLARMDSELELAGPEASSGGGGRRRRRDRSEIGASVVAAQRDQQQQARAAERGLAAGSELAANRTTITKVTNTSGFNSSAADVCYGNINLGVYKLNKVALKPVVKFRQSRKLMIELRTLKRLNHDNLCRFVGIVTEEPNSALVSEFCSKGSLREFFQDESMAIDLTFKYSIINDIMAGLLYLHSSPIGFHGRLKLSNCLVSSRFVVKLSDYGLHSLRDYLDDYEDDEVLMRKRVCQAPEHLKASNAGLKSGPGGSKKGDVYSFGLILYEIITNKIPFYNDERTDFIMPIKPLIDELRANGPLGPGGKLGLDLEHVDATQGNILALIELMKQCLQFEVSKRPSSASVGATIKSITRGITSKKLLENLTGRMEQYTNNLESLVEAKLATLVEEKQKTEELLYQFVPKSVASLLKDGQSVEPEAFDCVTVFYSDIVGFTSLSSESSPMEVIDFLSDLYLCFDETLEQYDIYKVDTIGDAYIVASGLPQRNEGKHVIEIARAALDLRDRLARFKIPHKPGRSLEMRVGIHSGPCIAGIVGGLNMPKYCVFGDTVSTGKFMESSGLPMKIHITEESKSLLDQIAANEFNIEPRLPKINKDGIPFQTYWLEDRSRSC